MKTEKYLEFDINYFQDEDGIFTATVPGIRGCIASGATQEEAYSNAIEAIDSCLEARSTILSAIDQMKVKNKQFNHFFCIFVDKLTFSKLRIIFHYGKSK